MSSSNDFSPFSQVRRQWMTKKSVVRTAKDLSSVFSSLNCNTPSQTILIEGVPGIGKTVLSKELAYQWSNGILFSNKSLLFLIFLRDPSISRIDGLADLVHYFYQFDDSATDISKSCADYLLKSEGHDILFILDGYDELAVKTNFIRMLVSRRVLPECSLVITSRSYSRFGWDAQSVYILGFDMEDKLSFIKCSLEEESTKIAIILDYLKTHPTLNNLCFIPFHMTVLIYLFKLGYNLPKNSTELYSHLICHTICHHLAKSGICLGMDEPDLNGLPEPFKKVIDSLAGLALGGVLNNQFTFSLREIKTACPQIDEVPEGIYGYGLLQAIETYGPLQKSLTLNFVHSSLQEYLAAYYITLLPPKEESELLKREFFCGQHLSLFVMYFGLTRGQRPVFQQLLKSNYIPIKLGKNALIHFHMYRCFHESDNEYLFSYFSENFTYIKHRAVVEEHKNYKIANEIDIYPSIEVPNVIAATDLYYKPLLPTDIENLTFFLTHWLPNKEWEKLSLDNCYIGDSGWHLFHAGVVTGHGTPVTIKELNLSNNFLTGASLKLIADVVVTCQIKHLIICRNKIGVQGFDKILSGNFSILESLNLDLNSMSSAEAIILFETLRKNDHLKLLELSRNNIGDEAVEAISATLKENSTLKELWLDNNPLTFGAALTIAQSLKDNSSIQLLWLPNFYGDGNSQTIKKEEYSINENRKGKSCAPHLHVCFVKVHVFEWCKKFEAALRLTLCRHVDDKFYDSEYNMIVSYTYKGRR